MTPSASSLALRVDVHWGAQQLASTLLHASRTRRFVLGAGPGVDFDVAVPSLGRDGRIVVVAGREGFRLSAPTGFGDLGDSDASAGFQIELAHLRLSATPVRLPPRAPALLLEGVNFNHANIVLVAAMLATVLVLALAERGEAGPDFDAWDARPAEAPRVVPLLPRPLSAPPRAAPSSPALKTRPPNGKRKWVERGTGLREVLARANIAGLFHGLGGGYRAALGAIADVRADPGDAPMGGLRTSGPAETLSIGVIGLRGAVAARKVDVVLKRSREDPAPFLAPESGLACEGEGCVSRELVRQVIRSHLEQVRYCYELSLGRNPGLEGRVRMRIEISLSGSVLGARVLEGIAGAGELGECLSARITTWVFPRLRSEVVVSYPFAFQRGGAPRG